MSEAKWYILHTYSGYENKVAKNIETLVDNRNLRHLIEEVMVPTEKIVEVHDGKTKEVESKLYPGYVYVKMVMTDDSWYICRNTRGVTGFVGPGSKPVPLTEEEIVNLGIVKQITEETYEIGEMVRIISGALADFEGIIKEIDKENGTVLVSVSMFGRETPTNLELSSIKKIL